MSCVTSHHVTSLKEEKTLHVVYNNMECNITKRSKMKNKKIH